jgi:hypothetical protein
MTSRQSLKRANPPPNRTTEERGNDQGQFAMPARLFLHGRGAGSWIAPALRSPTSYPE